MITFIIPGTPQGKARARTFKNKKTGKTVTTTPDNTVLYENLIKIMFKQAKGIMIEEGKPVYMSVTAFFDIPKSYTKGKRLAATHNIIRPTKKPDADNILKVVADALNGLAYKDDTQIVSAMVVKNFTEDEPRVVVTVGEI